MTSSPPPQEQDGQPLQWDQRMRRPSDNNNHQDGREVGFVTERLGSLFAQLRDPRSVSLSDIETVEAVSFKTLVQSLNDNKLKRPLSDFEYVEWSCYHANNQKHASSSAHTNGSTTTTTFSEEMEKTFHRMMLMESFRETYRVADTYEEGFAVLQQLAVDHPGIFVSVTPVAAAATAGGTLGGGGGCVSYLTILDLSAIDRTKLQTSQQQRSFVVGIYYLLQCQNCEFRSIREGQTFVVECSSSSSSSSEEVATTTNPSSSSSSHNNRMEDEEFFLRILHELDSWFPRKQKSLLILNPTFVVHHYCALWIRRMTPNQRETTVLGCQLPFQGERRIHGICKPIDVSDEVSQKTTILGLGALLAHRYQCVQTFRLPPTPTLDQFQQANALLNQYLPSPRHHPQHHIIEDVSHLLL